MAVDSGGGIGQEIGGRLLSLWLLPRDPVLLDGGASGLGSAFGALQTAEDQRWVIATPGRNIGRWLDRSKAKMFGVCHLH